MNNKVRYNDGVNICNIIRSCESKKRKCSYYTKLSTVLEMEVQRFSHRKPFLRVVNRGQRGALARTISTKHLIGHNEGYLSNTGHIRLNFLQVSSLLEHVKMALFIPLREPTARSYSYSTCWACVLHVNDNAEAFANLLINIGRVQGRFTLQPSTDSYRNILVSIRRLINETQLFGVLRKY
jgi:hypothetical protein